MDTEHIPSKIKETKFTIWCYISQFFKTTPKWLKNKTGFIVKYSDGTVTKVKLS